jgi:glycosyltransferase involved in cell wall biosynthesis
MRVAVVTDMSDGRPGGLTAALAAALAHRPEDVDLRLSATHILPAQWRRAPPDVIHLATAGRAGLAARWYARRHHIPLVGSWHWHRGDGATRWTGRLAHVTRRWFYGACHRLLVPSHAADRLLAEGYPAKRLDRWPCGVDACRFTHAVASPALRERWCVSEQRPALVYAGWLARQKELALFQSVSRLLLEHRLAHRLVFVGDGPMRRELERRCPDAVFTGLLAPEAVAVTLASADVFVSPSAAGSFGAALLEAQACGLPAVVADGGGLRENLLPGRSGFVCRAGDAADFADRIGRLLRQPDMRRQMGTAGRRYAETRSWPSTLVSLCRAWRDAAARAHTAGSTGRWVLPRENPRPS